MMWSIFLYFHKGEEGLVHRFLGKWTFRALSDSAAPGAQTPVPVPLSATEGRVVDQGITDSTTPQIQN